MLRFSQMLPGSATDAEPAWLRPEPTAHRWARRLARPATVAYVVLLLVAFHLPEVPGPDTGPSIVQLDKVFHVVALGGLTALLVLAKPLGAGAPRRLTLMVAAGLSLGLAWGVEQTQPLTGRSQSFADVVAGLVGILAVYLVAGARPLGRGWLGPIWAARGIGLLIVPGLLVATLAPRGGRLLFSWFWQLGLPVHDDQSLHFALTAGLVGLLALMCPLGRARPRLGAAAVIATAGLAGPGIEWLQIHTGRGSPSLADIWAHMQGLTVGLTVWALASTARDLGPALGRMPQVAALGRFVGLAVGTRAGVDDEPADQDTGHALAGHASLISGLTMVSRVTGLLRDATLAAIFGVSTIADAFFIGFLVPNLFRRLFGEGALAAAFVPRYAELRQSDPERARRFAGLSLAALMALLAAITLVGEAILWALLSAGGWSPAGSLTLKLTMWMLPYMPVVCGLALIGGMLQVHRRFGPPAAAPILLNLMVVAAALGASGYVAEGLSLSQIATVTAAAVLLAGIVQFVWQWIALWGVTSLAFGTAGVGAPMKRMIKAMGPLLLGLAVFQINVALDSLIALAFSSSQPGATLTLFGSTVAYPMQSGAVASLQWAQRLYQFPLGVFGIAIATAIFPALADAAARRNEQGGTDSRDDQLARILRQGLRLTMFIALPATVGLLLVRLPLVRVIYEHGAFTLADSQRVAWILAGYASAVWAYSLAHVLTRCFYAVGDEKAPVRISAMMVGVNLALNVTLIWPLGAAGLAWSTALCAAAQCVWLGYRVRQHVAVPIDLAVKRSWMRTAGLSAVMAIVLAPITWAVDAAGLNWPLTALLLAALVSIGAGIVFIGAYWLRAEELHWLLKRRAD
jgi:putative peptidoglycan lipid II flippase